MDLESLGVILKPKGDHGIKDVLAAYCFPLLHLAFLGRLGGDKADELRDALLNAFLGFFRYLCGRGH